MSLKYISAYSKAGDEGLLIIHQAHINKRKLPVILAASFAVKNHETIYLAEKTGSCFNSKICELVIEKGLKAFKEAIELIKSLIESPHLTGGFIGIGNSLYVFGAGCGLFSYSFGRSRISGLQAGKYELAKKSCVLLYDGFENEDSKTVLSDILQAFDKERKITVAHNQLQKNLDELLTDNQRVVVLFLT